MNKNPFLPQPNYQPPLPPGPPPPAAPYWPQQPNPVPQWTPPPEQSALYANYGYGPQGNWQRQQQQQQQQFMPPPPGYNPYQPAPVYPQPLPPQPPYVPQQQPQIFIHPPVQPQRIVHHPPPQHLPPAKRPRFDAPQRPPQQQQQFQPVRGGASARAAAQRPITRARGGSMNAIKSAGSGRGIARGGSFSSPGRGMPLRGRGNFANRRGGGSFSNSMRGRAPRKDATTTSGYGSVGKRDENRRTLTDFKIIGLEIPDLSWRWGVLHTEDSETDSAPSSRIRIYFHTPVTSDDSHPIPTVPSDSRKGKRKKLDDDDAEDGARDRPPPPQMSDDLSSVAPSVAESLGDDWLMAAIAESEKTESVVGEDEQNASEGDFADGNESNVVDSPAHLNGVAPAEPADAQPTVVEAESSHLPVSSTTEESSTVVDEPSADHIASESQVSAEQKTKSLSLQPTLLDVDSDSNVPVNGHDSAQTSDLDHLPEPPASISSIDDSKPDAKIPSANRLSVSYASGERRLVIDAEVVESLHVFREKGCIEIRINVTGENADDLKGILVESLTADTKSYTRLQSISELAENDPTIPPFANLTLPSTVTLMAYLDVSKPLSEPKWAKTGDVAEWLRSILGRMFWAAGEAAEGWEKRIAVEDPDPPPTIWSVLEAWASNSQAGVLAERQRFLKTHMMETDNMLEILLRLVRGERGTPFSGGQTSPLPNVSGPLFSALSPGSAHGSQQTHVSLAVLAMFRMAVEYAKKAIGDKGKVEVEERVGDIIRCIPSHLIYKSVDGIFKEWKMDAKKQPT